MFNRDWIIAGVSGLVLIMGFSAGGYILGFGLGKQTGQHDAKTQQYAVNAADQITSACATLDDNNQMECIVRVVEATNEQQRAEGDLNAQRNMARWALWMLVATVAMAFITAVGVYYVWRTLVATQRMAKDTRDIGERQVRAYIGIDNGQIVSEDDNPEQNAIFFAVTWKNFGLSPGMIESVTIGCRCYPLYTLQFPDFFFHQIDAPRSVVAPSGGGTATVVFDLGKDAVRAIKDYSMEIHIRVAITYSDVFGALETVDQEFFGNGPHLNAPLPAISHRKIFQNIRS